MAWGDLLDDRRKTRDNIRLRGRGFLRRGRRGGHEEAKQGADRQPEGPGNSSLHTTFPLQENRTLDRTRTLFANSIGNEGGTVAVATPQRFAKECGFAA
jgi:hypothetical protein